MDIWVFKPSSTIFTNSLNESSDLIALIIILIHLSPEIQYGNSRLNNMQINLGKLIVQINSS